MIRVLARLFTISLRSTPGAGTARTRVEAIPMGANRNRSAGKTMHITRVDRASARHQRHGTCADGEPRPLAAFRLIGSYFWLLQQSTEVELS